MSSSARGGCRHSKQRGSADTSPALHLGRKKRHFDLESGKPWRHGCSLNMSSRSAASLSRWFSAFSLSCDRGFSGWQKTVRIFSGVLRESLCLIAWGWRGYGILWALVMASNALCRPSTNKLQRGDTWRRVSAACALRAPKVTSGMPPEILMTQTSQASFESWLSTKALQLIILITGLTDRHAQGGRLSMSNLLLLRLAKQDGYVAALLVDGGLTKRR